MSELVIIEHAPNKWSLWNHQDDRKPFPMDAKRLGIYPSFEVAYEIGKVYGNASYGEIAAISYIPGQVLMCVETDPDQEWMCCPLDRGHMGAHRFDYQWRDAPPADEESVLDGPEMKVVDSSNVAMIGYDSDKEELHVVYKSSLDRTYVYQDFPRDDYETLIDSESVGRFITFVKRNHSFVVRDSLIDESICSNER